MPKYSLITRIRLEFFRRAKYGLFMVSGVSRAREVVSSLHGSDDPLFVAIGFNEPALARVQIQALRKYSQDSFSFLLADNSPTRELSKNFREVANMSGVTYVRLPHNFYTNSRGAAKPGRGSLSHSAALDWIWKHIIRPVNPPVVTVLDHDVFPLSPFSLSDSRKSLCLRAPSSRGK